MVGSHSGNRKGKNLVSSGCDGVLLCKSLSTATVCHSPVSMPKPYCRTETKTMEGHDLPRHEALQQDEATSAAHFRPAVLVPGVDVSHFHCAQVKREREREIEGERESGFLKTHRWAVLVPTSTQWGQVLRSDWLVTGDLVFSYAKCMFPSNWWEISGFVIETSSLKTSWWKGIRTLWSHGLRLSMTFWLVISKFFGMVTQNWLMSFWGVETAQELWIRLCDFGSAKPLVRGEPNVAYICPGPWCSSWWTTLRPKTFKWKTLETRQKIQNGSFIYVYVIYIYIHIYT